LSDMGDRAAAKAPMEQALALAPNDHFTHYGQAVLHSDCGRHAAAIQSMDQAIGLKPKWAGGFRVRAQLLLGWARYLHVQEQADAFQSLSGWVLPSEQLILRGLDDVAVALQYEARNVESYGVRVQLIEQLRSRPFSLWWTRREMKHNDFWVRLAQRLMLLSWLKRPMGRILTNRITRYEQSCIDFDRRLNYQNQFINAIQDLLSIAPENAQGQYSYGCCLMRDRRYTEAEQAFRTALRLQPNFVVAQRALTNSIAFQHWFYRWFGMESPDGGKILIILFLNMIIGIPICILIGTQLASGLSTLICFVPLPLFAALCGIADSLKAQELVFGMTQGQIIRPLSQSRRAILALCKMRWTWQSLQHRLLFLILAYAFLSAILVGSGVMPKTLLVTVPVLAGFVGWFISTTLES
jgi:tetratricopeptide (TPR) repeat protein